MRYSYLEIFVEDIATSADLRNDAYNYVKGSWDPDWHDTKEGLSFNFNEQDEEHLRSGTIRIPETHALFNFGLLEKQQYSRRTTFDLKLYLPVEEYVRVRLAKAGVPMTIDEAMEYDDKNQ